MLEIQDKIYRKVIKKDRRLTGAKRRRVSYPDALNLIAEKSKRTGGERYKEVGIVGLYLCLVRGFGSYRFAASVTLVYDYVASARVGQCAYRAQYASALVCSVTGVYINVERA